MKLEIIQKKYMKVLFDHQIFSLQKYGGISRYFANLHYGLNVKNESESKLGLLFTDNAYINNGQLPAGIFNTLIKKDSRRYKYNKWYCKYLLKQDNFDIFHPTYYHPYFLKSLKKPFVITVYDMIHELYPDYFSTDVDARNKREVIERADHIIAISANTKNDIQKLYNIDGNKISVTHLGYQMQFSGRLSSITSIEGRYLLFVGQRDIYKNFNLFVKAVAPVILKHKVKLICGGGGSFKPDELTLINKLNIADSVQQVAVNDDQLKHLYQHAIAFIFPSLYEGFGIPVLEAFSNNCPLIVSNTSSLNEVAGNAAEFFDPTDQESITFAIERVVSNNYLQDELRIKGKERLRSFSWEKCVNETLQVYRSLA